MVAHAVAFHTESCQCLASQRHRWLVCRGYRSKLGRRQGMLGKTSGKIPSGKASGDSLSSRPYRFVRVAGRKNGGSLVDTQGEYLSALAYRNQSGNYSVDATIRLFESHGLDNPRLEALRERGNAYANGCPLIPATFHRLRNGEFIHIGEHVWEVIVGYGHAVEHASFYCRKLNVLISGDMLLPSISTNIPVMASSPEGNPLKDFLDSIREYRKLPEDTLVLPSHGRPFIGIHSRVGFLEEHHRKRCEAVLSACSVPRTACEILPILFEKDITDAHQCLFAMGEAIAHLNYLEKQHKLEKREKNRRIRFVTA